MKQYFPRDNDFPPPLSSTITRRVRFEEVDALGMVWHGRYPSYLEDGRVNFGDTYHLSYQSFRNNKTVAPIVQMHIDYKVPLRFDELVQISTNLHWCEAAKLNFSYRIQNNQGKIAATGFTVQLLTALDGTILLTLPTWLTTFREQWHQKLNSKK